MHIINQPFEENIGHYLEKFLNEDYNNFYFMVAYAKNSGVLRLLSHMEGFKANGGKIKGIIGIDQFNTSIEAIENLLDISDELYIYYNESPTVTYHSKVYLFDKENSRAQLFVGSSNFTAGGLYTNYETNVYSEFDLKNPQQKVTVSQVLDMFSLYSDIQNNCCKKVDKELISNLISKNYIKSENDLKIKKTDKEHTGETGKNRKETKLFGIERFYPPTVEKKVHQKNTKNKKVKEIRNNESKLKEKNRTSAIKRVFTSLGEYNCEGMRNSVVQPTLDKFEAKDKTYSYKELYVDNNNRKYSLDMGIISPNEDGNYQLTEIGEMLWEDINKFPEIFQNQLLNYSKLNKDTKELLYPYRALFRVFEEIEELTKLEFLYTLYILKDTRDSSIKTAIENIKEIKSNYPDPEALDKKEKIKVLDEYNRKFNVPFEYDDVWTTERTTYNQFLYFKRHLLSFSTTFIDDKRRFVITKIK
ncbi:phospholipase D family protein [Priestia sp. 179-F W1.4 NHS]|uniref:phospholipase D family protein n=1 Tax=Priestia TaxID=2800373 RepID=UPI001CD817C4|nr:phospholipase D family protein [Priestia aryabhattai]MCA1052783.1 phospholipase D family protein [Priestia aryabhattai]